MREVSCVKSVNDTNCEAQQVVDCVFDIPENLHKWTTTRTFCFAEIMAVLFEILPERNSYAEGVTN